MVTNDRPRRDNSATDLTVLHVSSERGWRGGERQVLLLAGELSRRGVPQHVAAPQGSPLSERAREAGLDVVLLRPSPALHPANFFALLRWLRRQPGAILHTHTSPALSLASFARRMAPAGALVHTRRVAFPVRRSAKYRTV
ncbi:MAG: glycosyltransferase, partial [Deltaproteobacteria bacterium]|nr:glycosyltransferase [Deltaproteobacteria bacterium]